MDAAHPLENQTLAAIPHDSVDPEVKAEDRPTTAVVIELVPGENGVYKVATQSQGGVQLSDTEMALVDAYRAKVQEEEAAKAEAANAPQTDTTSPVKETLTDEEQKQLDDYNAFQAWKANQAAPVQQTGATTGDGTEDYTGPTDGGTAA